MTILVTGGAGYIGSHTVNMLQLSKRKVVVLERGIRAQPHAAPNGSSAKRPRFVAKGLRSQRARLGLSAADYGRLVGVSAQSIYNWEQASAIPRDEQLVALAALRGIAKREATARLERLDAKKAKPHKQTS